MPVFWKSLYLFIASFSEFQGQGVGPAGAVVDVPDLKDVPLRGGEGIAGSFGPAVDVHGVIAAAPADKALGIVLVMIELDIISVMEGKVDEND